MLARLLCCLLLLLPLTARAEGTSPVVLTVSGLVEEVNRGPFDPFTDALAARYIDPFEKAHAFTLAELRALPQQGLTLNYPSWNREVRFAGPSLASVLKAAGATGGKLELMAIDGYSAILERSMVEGGTFILALTADDSPLAVGGHGPIWLVFPPGEAAPAYPGEDDAGLVWGLFHILSRK